MNQILFYFSMGINFLADSTETGISGEPIKEWVLGKVTPILGIFSFVVVICVVFWTAWFCGAIVTSIITLIGVIIGVSVKRPKVKNTNEIKSDTLNIKNQIGKDENTTLIRDHRLIIEKISKNLENSDSVIISSLKEIKGFTNKQILKQNLLGKEWDFLKSLEIERSKDKLEIQNLQEKVKDLSLKMNDLNKEKENLLYKLKEFDKDYDIEM